MHDLTSRTALVAGGGPAGLMAAEVLARAGLSVTVCEKMPSVGRRLLMAGRGGLNLTHSEAAGDFVRRYGEAAAWMAPRLEAFAARDLIGWAEGLGQETFVGSSGRVFPKAFKASPLLRAWLGRLSDLGVTIRTRTRWVGFDDKGALIDAGEGPRPVAADVVVLALGGASWPKLGADGGWVAEMEGVGVAVAPLRAANSGVNIAWTPLFRERFAGQPLKSVALSAAGRTARGEAVVTAYGLEGGAVYALSAAVREAAREGPCPLVLDLRPQSSLEAFAARIGEPRPGQSLANRLRKAGLAPVAVNLLREAFGSALPASAAALAQAVKAVPLTATGVQPLARAISTAGGVDLNEVDDRLMLRAHPGVFVAGEMLDWEAPTGGYLLQASFATGAAAAEGALAWLRGRETSAQ